MSFVGIVHELPKRLRLRLTLDAEAVTATASELRRLSGIRDVAVSPACASAVVIYDGQPAVRKAVLALVQRPPRVGEVGVWQPPP